MTANLCHSNRAAARMPAGPLDPAPPVNGFTGASPLGAFFDEVIVPCRLSNAAPRTLEYYHVAVVHLGGYLGREPRIDDLTSKTIGGVMRWLIERGRTAQTANYSRCAMLAFAQVAVERGLLPEGCSSAPKMAHKYKRRSPWSIDELNHIILYAAANIGDVAGIPAGRWWPALLLTVLDTHLSAETLLLLSSNQLDLDAGTLAEADLLCKLHPRTLKAIKSTFDGPRPQLFPWHLDGCRPPFHMLFYHYRRTLERAGLPATPNDLFRRLVFTARKSGPRLIDRLDLTPLENPPAWADTYTGDNANRGRPRAKRKRSRSAAAKPIAAAAGPKKLYVIDLKSERTLKDFFETRYRPNRLLTASPATVQLYASTIRRLRRFLHCDPTVDCLCDDLVEDYMKWLHATGRSPATCNGECRRVCALWRYAHKKHLIDHLPGVDLLREPKRLPTAFSIGELERLLRAAAATEGSINGIPAGLFWPALILTLYDSGLRVGALRQLKTSDLDCETGWLRVPAKVQKQLADQCLHLQPDTVKAILATLPERREILFSKPFAMHAMRRRYREILQRAGLDTGRRWLFHTLRKTSATHICNRLDIEAARRHLGHRNIQTTLRYIDPTRLDGSTADDVLPRPNWKES